MSGNVSEEAWEVVEGLGAEAALLLLSERDGEKFNGKNKSSTCFGIKAKTRIKNEKRSLRTCFCLSFLGKYVGWSQTCVWFPG